MRVATDVAIYTLNQKRRELARLENEYDITISLRAQGRSEGRRFRHRTHRTTRSRKPPEAAGARRSRSASRRRRTRAGDRRRRANPIVPKTRYTKRFRRNLVIICSRAKKAAVAAGAAAAAAADATAITTVQSRAVSGRNLAHHPRKSRRTPAPRKRTTQTRSANSLKRTTTRCRRPKTAKAPKTYSKAHSAKATAASGGADADAAAGAIGRILAASHAPTVAHRPSARRRSRIVSAARMKSTRHRARSRENRWKFNRSKLHARKPFRTPPPRRCGR